MNKNTSKRESKTARTTTVDHTPLGLRLIEAAIEQRVPLPFVVSGNHITLDVTLGQLMKLIPVEVLDYIFEIDSLGERPDETKANAKTKEGKEKTGKPKVGKATEEIQRDVLHALEKRPGLTALQLQGLIPGTPEQRNAILKGMIEGGHLRKEGKARGTKYFKIPYANDGEVGLGPKTSSETVEGKSVGAEEASSTDETPNNQ